MKSKYRILAVVLFLSLTVTLVLPFTASAAAVSSYSSVLEDLSRDSSFNVNSYPNDPTNYGLRVIQIAEGDGGNLYVYVYQPSDATRDFKAKYINMSIQNPAEKELQNRLYSLTWLSSYGTLDKYLVNGFKVSDAPDRYYNIAAIYRLYDASIDTVSEAIDSVQCKGYEVGQYWHTYYYNDVLRYESKKIDIVDVRIRATGSIRYENGLKFGQMYIGACDSHYVAFSIENFNVQEIFDADITYTINNYSWSTTYTPYNHIEELTSSTFVERDYLSAKETASNDGSGWFGKTYTWNRIQHVDTFISDVQNNANEEFSAEELAALEESEFVFRFLETNYTLTPGSTASFGTFSETENIGILRLHFLSDGKYYNLGVVSDMVGTDSTPDLDVSLGDNVKNFVEEMDEYLGDFFNVLLVIIFIVVACVLFVLTKPFWIALFRGVAEMAELIWATLTLPFKLLAGKQDKNKRK